MSVSMGRRPFTGRHMTVILVAFFGVVIAVNIAMARLAAGTFGGTVVDNSYVASQKFNGWLAAGRAQARLGWTHELSVDAARRPVLSLATADGDTAGFTASGTAHHPLGRAPDRVLDFRDDGSGRLVATAPLPAGRWQVRVTVHRGDAVLKLDEVLS